MVFMEEKEIKELLLKENKEFRKAFKQHQQYERDLAKFKQKSYPTDAEILEEKAIKKKKLLLKDKMYLMIEEYRKTLKS